MSFSPFHLSYMFQFQQNMFYSRQISQFPMLSRKHAPKMKIPILSYNQLTLIIMRFISLSNKKKTISRLITYITHVCNLNKKIECARRDEQTKNTQQCCIRCRGSTFVHKLNLKGRFNKLWLSNRACSYLPCKAYCGGQILPN